MNEVHRMPQSLRTPALLCTALLVLAGAALPARAQAPSDAELRQQLDDARQRLDDAARDVAELTGKLSGDEMPPPPRGGGSSGSMLGVNIAGGSDRAEGVEVMGISPSGPAERAGLRKGDVLVAVDGKALRKSGERTAGRQLVEQMRDVPPGQKIKVDYLRDGKPFTAMLVTVPAEPAIVRVMRERRVLPEGMPFPPVEIEEFLALHDGGGFRALELVPMTAQLGRYFGTDKGLLVVKAPGGEGATLEEGDVILSIGGRTAESPKHAFRILRSYQPDEKVKVEVLRLRKRQTLELKVPAGDPMSLEFERRLPPPRAPRPAPPPAPAVAAPVAGVSS
jgi:predicted metalloprotease with PDZ domain